MTVRIPNSQLPQRLGLYAEGLAESGLDADRQRALRADAAIWRHVYVAGSRSEAESHLREALLHTRHHMNHARDTYNPGDFEVDPALLNAWADPSVPDDAALVFAMDAALCGTPDDVCGRLEALRDAGAGHVLCQMSFGYLQHERILRSMELFGRHVMPRFR